MNNAMKTSKMLDSIVPISRFNKGEANKIFREVKKSGVKIVMKNNSPECVLISPESYKEMVEEYEDSLLLAEAERRLSKKQKYISEKDVMKEFGITEAMLAAIDDVEIE